MYHKVASIIVLGEREEPEELVYMVVPQTNCSPSVVDPPGIDDKMGIGEFSSYGGGTSHTEAGDGQTEGITSEKMEMDRQLQINRTDGTWTTYVETDPMEELAEHQVDTYQNREESRVVPDAPLFGTLPWTYDIEDDNYKEETVQSPYEMYEWTSTKETTSYSQAPTGMEMVKQWLIRPTDTSKLELQTSESMERHIDWELDPGDIIRTIDGKIRRMVGETGESQQGQMTCQFNSPKLILNGPPVNRIVKEMVRARPSEKPPWKNSG
jgi:hypothetical protein